MADCTKLPPMVIFKQMIMPKESLPSGCVETVNKKGWMNKDVMDLWKETCWRKRPRPIFEPDSLLAFDAIAAHITEDSKVKFKGQKI